MRNSELRGPAFGESGVLPAAGTGRRKKVCFLTLFINTNFIVEVNGVKYFIFSLLLAAIVIFNHRENIKRIANGTENKLSFKNTNK